MHVFLSYNNRDGPFADLLCSAIQAEGIDVWRDTTTLGAGDRWMREIDTAVREASSVLVVWSSLSVESEWVRAEAMAGWEERKLLQVIVDDVRLPVPFGSVEAVDLRGWRGDPRDAAYQKLLSALVAASDRSGHGHSSNAWAYMRTLRGLQFKQIALALLLTVLLMLGLGYTAPLLAPQGTTFMAATILGWVAAGAGGAWIARRARSSPILHAATLGAMLFLAAALLAVVQADAPGLYEGLLMPAAVIGAWLARLPS